jgi:hypothetical protein
LRRPLPRRRVDVEGRHHPVDQADAQRTVRVEGAPREDQVFRARWADQPSQPLRAARPGDHTEQDFRLADLGILGADTHIGGQREFAAAAERIASDRRDDRLGNRRHRRECRVQRLDASHHVGVAHGGHLFDVGSGGERARAAVEDDSPDVAPPRGLDGHLM